MAALTAHAIRRYRERIEPCTAKEARAKILAASRGIDAAADFGCHLVRLGNGARLRLDGDTVVTVLAKA